MKRPKKLKHWIDCNIRRTHYVDMGKDPKAWLAETNRQCETVGYVNCYCQYCGRYLFRIID